jgi:hypothetical protein
MGSYPEPTESSPHSSTKVLSSFEFSQLKFCMYFLPTHRSHPWFNHPNYTIWRVNYKVPHYVFSSFSCLYLSSRFSFSFVFKHSQSTFRLLLNLPMLVLTRHSEKNPFISLHISVLICCFQTDLRSRDSPVSIVTRLRVGRPGLDSRQRQKHCLFRTASRQALRST